MTNHSDDTIRRGSPFAQSSNPVDMDSGSVASANPQTPLAIDTVSLGDTLDPEWGVLKAAIWASAWVAIFAVACYQMFPGGGVLVSALGCSLAIVGLFSSRPLPASVLLVAHAGLFFACYQRLF